MKDLEGKTILVTGGTGSFGRSVLKRLKSIAGCWVNVARLHRLGRIEVVEQQDTRCEYLR